MTSQKTRGRPGGAQGQKPLAQGAPSVLVSVRLTPAQRDQLRKLGGSGWVRRKIDESE